jgi:hypothetical protein
MNQSAWSDAPRGELSRADLRRAAIAGIEHALGPNNTITTSGLYVDEEYRREGQRLSVNGVDAVSIFPADAVHPTGMYVVDGMAFMPTDDGLAVARQVAAALQHVGTAPFASRTYRSGASGAVGVDPEVLYDAVYTVAQRALQKLARRTFDTDAPSLEQKSYLARTLAERLQDIARDPH